MLLIFELPPPFCLFRELVLLAEAKLGELLIKSENREPIKTPDGSIKGTIGKLPNGINKKESHYAHADC